MRRCFLALTLGVAFAGAPLAAQNLLVNPDFDADASGWLLACGSNPTWITDDEAGCPLSGAVHVTSGSCQGLQGSGMAQCFPASEGTVLFAGGSGQGALGLPRAGISSYPTTDCSGPPATTVNSPLDPATGDWQTVVFDDFAVPAGTASVLVGFGAGDFTPVDADIDAGYAGESGLVFHDDFEADSASAPPTCRWSSIAP
jgi:hypothetical protein